MVVAENAEKKVFIVHRGRINSHLACNNKKRALRITRNIPQVSTLLMHHRAHTYSSREAKFIMDGISKKLIKDGIHRTIRVIFLALVSF